MSGTQAARIKNGSPESPFAKTNKPMVPKSAGIPSKNAPDLAPEIDGCLFAENRFPSSKSGTPKTDRAITTEKETIVQIVEI
jgi:hypothetical protein